MKFWYIYGRKFTKYLHGTQSLLNILKISGIKKKYYFDPYSVFEYIQCDLPSLNQSSAHPSVWNCLVQLSYQIWPQKTTSDSPDCWANHWYNPPHSPRTVLIQSEWKGCQYHSGPSHPAHSLFELLPSGRRYRALSTRTTRHRNSFFPRAIHLMNTWD